MDVAPESRMISTLPTRVDRRGLGYSFVVIAAAAMALVGAYVAGRVGGYDAAEITRDPPGISGAAYHVGLLSFVGIIGWATAAALAAFGAVMLRRSSRASALGLGALSLVSSILLFDDLLLLHERILPDVFGLPERLTFALYGLAGLGALWLSRALIDRRNIVPLALAALAFAGSLAVDAKQFAVERRLGVLRILVEDCSKLCGIWLWATFIGLAVATQLMPRSVAAGVIASD